MITVETGTSCLLPALNEKGRAGTEEDFLVGDSEIVGIIFAFGDMRSADGLWEESGSKLRRQRKLVMELVLTSSAVRCKSN